MTLSLKLSVVEISTLWHFRRWLLIQMFIKVAPSPRLSGIGMHSPILWSHLLKMQRVVLLSSLLWWELGTNSLITGPGEWLSFWRFTSKLTWSWSYSKLKIKRIVLLSSLLWWELGTNSLITGPGEWLSFRRFTSKLSWSWSNSKSTKWYRWQSVSSVRGPQWFSIDRAKLKP